MEIKSESMKIEKKQIIQIWWICYVNVKHIFNNLHQDFKIIKNVV